MAGLDSYVKLYCNFNGTDASTTILDDYGGKTITVNGNAQLDTAQKKFGTASLLLDGNGDFLSVADHADFYFDGDFTVDCQVRINSLPSSGAYATIFAQRTSSTSQNSLGLFIKNDAGTYQLYASFTFDGTTEKTLITEYPFATGQFYHIEICREGEWLGYFVDGENIGTYHVGTSSLHNSTAEFKIGGSNATTANYFNGWVDEFRLSKGICRHTLVSYTPPTTQYTADSYDKLLLHMDGSNDGTTFTDSATSKTVTVTGNAVTKTSVDNLTAPPPSSPGMCYFDGVGDYLSIADSDDFSFGTSEFSLKISVFFPSVPSSFEYALFSQNNNDASNFMYMLIGKSGSSYYLQFRVAGSGVTLVDDVHTISTISANTWYTFEVKRVGNNLEFYQNTVKQGTSTAFNKTYPNLSYPMIIGYSGFPSFPKYLPYYLDEAVIVKNGTTVLQVGCTGNDNTTTFTDSATSKTITTYGEAKIVNYQSVTPKIGTALGYFDGSGDYLSLADSDDWAFGAGDFNIDFYCRPFPGFVLPIISQALYYQDYRGQQDTAYYLVVNNGGNGNHEFYYSDADGVSNYSSILGYYNIPIGAWLHVAINRIGTKLCMFINGYLVSSKQIGAYNIKNSSRQLNVGYVSANGDKYYNGCLDELRISKGIARFEPASFTPPTSEYGGTTITTGTATNVTQSQFDISGTVTSESTVTERGFVYAVTANPTTSNSKQIVSGTTGAMSATITGLSPNFTYYVRAYAIVGGTTYYGSDVSVATTTRQGVLLEILEYQSTETAEATTSTSQIKITAHGLSTHDMIVNTSCRTQDAERGARLVGATGLTADIIPLDDVISTQSAGDSVRLYKYIDRTDLVRIKTFRMTRRTGGKTEANFILVTDNTYIPRAGQYVRINWNVSETSTRKFLGIIKSVRMVAASESRDELFLSISCVGLNQIPSRRTIQVVYSEGDTYGSIVEDMVDGYLYQDGIRKSTIDAGETLQDDWNQDVVSISEVLDECASKSGYQWFINDEGLLCFYQDPASVPDAIYDITDAGAFKDYTNLEFEESIDNYINKMFIAGGRDTLNDNDIIIGSEDFTASTAMQNITAGTGVYGTVQRDAGIVESNFVTAEAGTTTTNIKVTAHGQETGYMVYNATRQEYRQITKVGADNFSVSEISGQTTGDQIVFFDQANKLIANEFKIRGFMPKKFSFVTREMGFEPGSKIQVDLARYGISTEYYVIDDVEIFDEGGTVQTFRCRVSCSLRDNSNFTTQRLPNFYNYFGGF